MRAAALWSVALCRSFLSSSFPLPRLPFTLPVIILLTFFRSNLPKKKKQRSWVDCSAMDRCTVWWGWRGGARFGRFDKRAIMFKQAWTFLIAHPISNHIVYVGRSKCHNVKCFATGYQRKGGGKKKKVALVTVSSDFGFICVCWWYEMIVVIVVITLCRLLGSGPLTFRDRLGQ